MESDVSGQWQKMVTELSAELKMAPDIFVRELSQRWQRLISLTQVLHPLFIAGALQVLYFGRGRFFVEHLVFGLHYLTFLNFALLIFWPVYALTGVQATVAAIVVSVISFVWTGVYIVLAVRRAYAETMKAAIWKGILVYLGYYTAALILIYAELVLAAVWLVIEAKS
jgi:hypothetical protein